MCRPSGLSNFEQWSTKLRLAPNQYEKSAALKTWVRKNRNQKYIPPELLKAWGLSSLSLPGMLDRILHSGLDLCFRFIGEADGILAMPALVAPRALQFLLGFL